MMTTKWQARAVMVLLPIAVACGDASEGPQTGGDTAPADWVRLDSPCGYSFQAPPDAVEEPVQGVDSCVDQYRTEGCLYHGDYGSFGTSWDGTESYPEYTQSQLEIDGLEATLITARIEEDMPERPYLAAVDFVPDSRGAYLDMHAFCIDEAGQNEAKLVFQTILRPRPE